MKTIWKFPFYARDSVAIEMPRGAVILDHVHAPGTAAGLVIWAEVDTEAPTETRVLHVVGTGGPMPARPVRRIGTAIAGPFVWHVYEAIEVQP